MKTPRRTALTLLAAVTGVAALSGCATFDDADVAARVGDRSLTDDQVAAVANSPIAEGAVSGGEDGTLDAEVARRIVTVWVRNAALADAPFLAEIDLDDVRVQLSSELGDAFITADEFSQQLLIDNAAVSTAIQQGLIDEADAFALVSAAEVDVDARYGTWDAERLEVVALGS